MPVVLVEVVIVGAGEVEDGDEEVGGLRIKGMPLLCVCQCVSPCVCVLVVTLRVFDIGTMYTVRPHCLINVCLT